MLFLCVAFVAFYKDFTGKKELAMFFLGVCHLCNLCHLVTTFF